MNEFHPFGMQIENQSYTSSSNAYRYGFNGMEMDNTVKGEGNSYDFGARIYDARLGTFHCVDQKYAQVPQWSTYSAFGDNPIFYVDPDGKLFVNFDQNGNVIGIEKDTKWHNFWHGKKGRILNSNGDVERTFRFADPSNDVDHIRQKVITKLIIVKYEDVETMVNESGAFQDENKKLTNRYKYALKEGQGGGKLDFSVSHIPGHFGVPYPYKNTQTQDWEAPTIFLVGKTAHNHMNFGNFLFGAAMHALKFNLTEIQLGAHYNSLKNSSKNGYDPQLDSRDDQSSIRSGFAYGQMGKFRDITNSPSEPPGGQVDTPRDHDPHKIEKKTQILK